MRFTIVLLSKVDPYFICSLLWGILILRKMLLVFGINHLEYCLKRSKKFIFYLTRTSVKYCESRQQIFILSWCKSVLISLAAARMRWICGNTSINEKRCKAPYGAPHLFTKDLHISVFVWNDSKEEQMTSTVHKTGYNPPFFYVKFKKGYIFVSGIIIWPAECTGKYFNSICYKILSITMIIIIIIIITCLYFPLLQPFWYFFTVKIIFRSWGTIAKTQ